LSATAAADTNAMLLSATAAATHTDADALSMPAANPNAATGSARLLERFILRQFILER
jgi:hypothetical protein